MASVVRRALALQGTLSIRMDLTASCLDAVEHSLEWQVVTRSTAIFDDVVSPLIRVLETQGGSQETLEGCTVDEYHWEGSYVAWAKQGQMIVVWEMNHR